MYLYFKHNYRSCFCLKYGDPIYQNFVLYSSKYLDFQYDVKIQVLNVTIHNYVIIYKNVNEIKEKNFKNAQFFVNLRSFFLMFFPSQIGKEIFVLKYSLKHKGKISKIHNYMKIYVILFLRLNHDKQGKKISYLNIVYNIQLIWCIFLVWVFGILQIWFFSSVTLFLLSKKVFLFLVYFCFVCKSKVFTNCQLRFIFLSDTKCDTLFIVIKFEILQDVKVNAISFWTFIQIECCIKRNIFYFNTKQFLVLLGYLRVKHLYYMIQIDKGVIVFYLLVQIWNLSCNFGI
eukprot:TRINITY_DN3793_c1_g1_i8.p1 TRINITY_DN3793_c1_g1~~TRINITY_DN3793_c1_g1_i8.p1  ORF type:complete len:287 (-),score=-21.23 TRINITY_DN3793_c1_g1_i8:635-1495(-)